MGSGGTPRSCESCMEGRPFTCVREEMEREGKRGGGEREREGKRGGGGGRKRGEGERRQEIEREGKRVGEGDGEGGKEGRRWREREI